MAIPEKGSSKSQYVLRQKIKQEKEEKAEKKNKYKKKFINMALNTKKFNGVVLGSDHFGDVSQMNNSRTNSPINGETSGLCFDNDEQAQTELID